MEGQYRVPTGQRMGTSYRAPTAYRGDVNLAGLGGKEVKVVDRPITRGGLSGMKAGGQGPGRAIYDKSYYIGIIRQKNSELRQEIQRFQDEMEDINRNNDQYLTLEKKYEGLLKEVRSLEGELADYNLTLDKKRGDTRIEDVQATFEHIRAQNERQRQQLDDLFIERKKVEEEVAVIDGDIQAINSQSEQRLNELDPEERAAYVELQRENKSLEDEIAQKRAMLEQVNQKLTQAEAKIRTDVMKQKAHYLRDQKKSLVSKKEDLEAQTNEQNLSFPEARERLLNRVKGDNADVTAAEKRIAEVKKAIENYKRQIEEMEADLREQGTDENIKKYEILYQKDQEMTQFIESFEPAKQAELAQTKALQESIVSLLESSSEYLERKDNLPSLSQVQDMKQEYDLKTGLVRNDAMTAERLKVEFERAREDLEKMKTLDVKLVEEIKGMNEKLTFMQTELRTKLNSVENMKANAEAEIARSRLMNEALQAKKEALIQVHRSLSMKESAKTSQLAENKYHKELAELEQKMSMNEQNLFSLRSFIESKSSETNYEPISADCKSLLLEINAVLASKGEGY